MAVYKGILVRRRFSSSSLYRWQYKRISNAKGWKVDVFALPSYGICPHSHCNVPRTSVIKYVASLVLLKVFSLFSCIHRNVHMTFLP